VIFLSIFSFLDVMFLFYLIQIHVLINYSTIIFISYEFKLTILGH